MINQGRLEIFESFWIDKGLKKKNTEDSNNVEGSNIVTLPDGRLFMPSTVNMGGETLRGFLQSSSTNVRGEDVTLRAYADYVYSQNRTIINWAKLKFVKLITSGNPNKIKAGAVKYQDIDLFFKNIHDSIKELDVKPESVEFYIDAIKTASENNQTALVEILASKRNVILRQLHLLKLDKIKYVDEEDVVKFFELSKVPGKVLKLTYLRNFVRIIPSEVVEIKNKLDEHGAFDNYVVLHFDKIGDSTELTKAQKEKAKDPILFGLIAGSRKLYYVGDWIDEYCDLTLNKLLKTLEIKKAKELTKTTIKKTLLNLDKI